MICSESLPRAQSPNFSKIFQLERKLCTRIHPSVFAMRPIVIKCVYKGGIFWPRVCGGPGGRQEVKILLNDKREEILDRYASAIKLDRTVFLEEILDLGDDRWPLPRRASVGDSRPGEPCPWPGSRPPRLRHLPSIRQARSQLLVRAPLGRERLRRCRSPRWSCADGGIGGDAGPIEPNV